MPRTRSQTAALLAQQITELAMGDMTSRITNTPNKKHKTPPNKQNTPKKKKKRRKRGSSLSMRKKATNTKGQGDGSENNPYTATRRSTKRRIKHSMNVHYDAETSANLVTFQQNRSKRLLKNKGMKRKCEDMLFNKTESIRKCTIKSKQNEIAKKKQIYRESVLKSQEDKIKTLKTKQKELNLFKSYQIIPFYGSQSVLEQELNVFINRIGNENAKVNLYKKKCEFYADRLRFFKYCINEKLTVNLSGAKCTLELLQKECYRLIDKHKIYSEPQVHIHKMSEVLTEIKNPIGIFDTTVAQQGHYSYHYDGVRHQRRKVANEDDK
eukprot:693873_1